MAYPRLVEGAPTISEGNGPPRVRLTSGAGEGTSGCGAVVTVRCGLGVVRSGDAESGFRLRWLDVQ